MSDKNVPIYLDQGGAKETFETGAEIELQSGSTLDVQTGTTVNLVGVDGTELGYLDGLTIGTVTASKALVVDANKDLSALRNLTVTNLDAGASGTAGTLDIFPATATTGKTQFSADDNTGDTTTTIKTALQTGARTYTVPDAGESASFIMSEGAQTINDVKTFGNPIVYKYATGITAFATGGQASAVALTAEWNNVTTCATAGDSVKLLPAVIGQTQTVKNSGATALAVFPSTSDAINALAADLAVFIPPSGELTFRAIDSTTWETKEVFSSPSPSTLSGWLTLKAADSAGNTETLITNASQAAARTYSIPDAGANANFVLSTGAQTDALATSAEIATLNLAPFLVTTDSTTPAAGSCAAQFTVKNAAGVAVAEPVSLECYLTTSATGLTHNAAATSIAVLTNGALTVEDATALVGPFFRITTTAAGLIGLTLTSGAGTYYVAFILPNGKLAMSSAIVVN